MASSTTGSGGHYLFLVALSALLLSSAAAYDGQLTEEYYSTTCPQLNKIVEDEVTSSLSYTKGGPRMGASLLRLFFHDCFVQGCDASVLLDDDPTKVPAIISEKNALPNFNSLQGFDVINRIKDEVEKQGQCPGVVSCADILALATKQAVIALGGPQLQFLLGRHDSTTANKTQAESDLPAPSSNLTALIAAFGKKNFTPREMVTLSGAHTIGMARCTNVDDTQKARCISATTSNFLLPLDKQSQDKFDNKYYCNLPNDGLLHSDRVLVDDTDDLKGLVEQYKVNEKLFFEDFAEAMDKMSKMSVLTGSKGQIRRDCRKVNGY